MGRESGVDRFPGKLVGEKFLPPRSICRTQFQHRKLRAIAQGRLLLVALQIIIQFERHGLEFLPVQAAGLKFVLKPETDVNILDRKSVV